MSMDFRPASTWRAASVVASASLICPRGARTRARSSSARNSKTVIIIGMLVRRALDRRRMAAWDRDWLATGPRWTPRR
jgi:hypothetical protein